MDVHAFMSMLHVLTAVRQLHCQAACKGCMSFLNVHAACTFSRPCCMSMLHVTSMLHVISVLQSMFRLHVDVHAACPCCMSMLHVFEMETEVSGSDGKRKL
jgi:hypothetical protein